MHRASALLVAVLLLLGACGSDSDSGSADLTNAERVVPLIEASGQTILGQDFDYPPGATEITTSVLTLQPGEETGWHHHEAPLIAYVIHGAITVDYRDEGTRTYETGDALIEALEVSHNGMTEGDEPVQLLVVNLGSDQVENTVSDG
jgi:quercetin dioxygenase-like cupin family protein